jgi:hypothetical protein
MQKTIAEIGETNINNAQERFKKIEELGKKVLGKDFKLDETMKNIREKLAKIDFTIMDPTTAEKFKIAIGQLTELTTMFTSLGQISDVIKGTAASMKNIGDKDKGPLHDLAEGAGKVFGGMATLFPAIKTQVEEMAKEGLADVAKSLAGQTQSVQTLSTSFTTFKGSLISIAGVISAVVAKLPKAEDSLSIESFLMAVKKMAQVMVEANNVKQFDLSANYAAMSQNLDLLMQPSGGTGQSMADTMKKAATQLAPIATDAESTSKAVKSISDAMTDVTSVLSKITAVSGESVKEGVKKMVDGMNELNKGLDDLANDSAMGNINLKLGKIVNGLGIKDAKYTFAHAPVVLSMKINVQMDAHELEKVVVNAESSIIRTTLDAVAQQSGPANVNRTGKPDGSLEVKSQAT